MSDSDPAAKSKPPPWEDWLKPAASYLSELLARPRLRLIATGAVLLLIGGILVPNSVWTLPVVIIGAVMVAIGWLGGRLDGRLAVEWGHTGTQLEFRARIAAPSHQRQEPEIIDGTAHTVELELAELEALIVAAETPEAETAPAASTRAVEKLRVARTGSRIT